ncbi:MAG: sterol desaturase family protein [Myxococcota bacterium]
MSPNQVAVVLTPVFLGLMGLEWLVARAQGFAAYAHRQTLNNLGVFAGARAFLAALGLVPLAGYAWLLDHVAPVRLPSDHWGTWVFGFFVVDLAIWLRHWAAHRTGLLWAMHAVHHQSREYNLSVASRLSWFADTVLVGLPMVALGLPLEVASTWFVVGNLWMLVQHTETIGKLGFLDRLLVTPANHRVHHGCNPAYLDKNYGGILAVWDHLAGTFEPERERVVYGVLTGLNTWDATENNLEPFRRLWRKMAAAPSAWVAAQMLFRPPGWSPVGGEAPPVQQADAAPLERRPSAVVRAIATAGTLAALAGGMVVSWNAESWPWAHRIAGCAAVWLAIALSGVALDMRPVAPVPMPTLAGRLQAAGSAALLTLAGPYARGPLYLAGKWLEPRS